MQKCIIFRPHWPEGPYFDAKMHYIRWKSEKGAKYSAFLHFVSAGRGTACIAFRGFGSANRGISGGSVMSGGSRRAPGAPEVRIHAGTSVFVRHRLGSSDTRRSVCMRPARPGARIRAGASACARPRLGNPIARERRRTPGLSRKAGYTQERLHAPGLVSEIRSRGSVGVRPAFRNLDTRGSDGVRPAASRSGGESCASHGQVRRPRPKPPDCKFARLKLYLLTDGLPSMRARRGGAEDKRIRRQAVNRRSKFRQDSQRGQPACAASTPRKLAGSCPFRGTENAPGSFAPNPRLYVRRQ